MEVAFNVAWGPLSQIAVPLIDINSAIQLAVGAYGWWKAKERSQSLEEMIHANGGHLSPTSSFDMSRYLAIRQRFQFRGIVWFDGRLESIPLPNASTARFGDPGRLCLRAITTAILALYDVGSTTDILAHVIPYSLINYDLEGDCDRFVVNGPFFESVRQFVSSVADEEHCNTMRKCLHQQIDEGYSKLFAKSNSEFPLQDIHDKEIPIVIGFFKWLLMSPSSRDTDFYPTRSLACWSLAVMLSYLGFHICPSNLLVTSKALYEEHMESSCKHPFQPMVSLVVCSGCDTDMLTIPAGSVYAKTATYSSRIVPIKAVPHVIFQHLRNKGQSVEVDLLCDIWGDAFQHASSSVGAVRPVCAGITREIHDRLCRESGETAEVEPVVHYFEESRDHYVDEYMQVDMSALGDVVTPLLRKYIPGPDWSSLSLQNIIGVPRSQYRRSHERKRQDDSPWIDRSIVSNKKSHHYGTQLDTENWYKFTAILLATLYAVCSKPFLDTEFEPRSGESNSLMEVSVYPDLLTDNTKREQIKDCFIDLSNLLHLKDDQRTHSGNPIQLERFASLVGGVCTGEMNSNRYYRDALGCHANGILIITDMALRPSLNPTSVIRFHICQGQPLQFPIFNQRVNAYEDHVANATSVSLNTESFPIINSLECQESDTNARIDLEPYWERDPQSVIFRVRIDGLVKWTFSPMTLLSQFDQYKDESTQFVFCECDSLSGDVSVPESQGWKSLKLSDLLISSGVASFFSDRYLEYNEPESSKMADPLFISVRGDKVGQVLGCVCFQKVSNFVALQCMKCAYDVWNSYKRIAIGSRSQKPEGKSLFHRGSVVIDGL